MPKAAVISVVIKGRIKCILINFNVVGQHLEAYRPAFEKSHKIIGSAHTDVLLRRKPVAGCISQFRPDIFHHHMSELMRKDVEFPTVQSIFVDNKINVIEIRVLEFLAVVDEYQAVPEESALIL